MVSRRLIWRRYKAMRMDDFEKEAHSYRQSIDSLSKEISQNAQAVTDLESEKIKLQWLVHQYQSKVSECRLEYRAHQGEIEQADTVKDDITMLNSHAASMNKNMLEALSDLQHIKHSLEQCSEILKERSINLSSSNSSIDKIIVAVLGVVPMAKRSRYFNDYKKLLHKALGILDQVHGEVPKLLPRIGGTRLLDIKPWDSGSSSITGIKTPIPNICYY